MMSAMWRSRKVARLSDRSSASSSASGRTRHRSRAALRAGDPLAFLDVAVPLCAGVERRAEDADRVRLSSPEERSGHGDVVVDAREAQRLPKLPDAARLRGGDRRLPVGDARGRAAEHVAHLVLREPRHERGPQRDQLGLQAAARRVVRCVENLARGDPSEHVQEVDRAPDRGVEVDAAASRSNLRVRRDRRSRRAR